jgi:hypothetical protein
MYLFLRDIYFVFHVSQHTMAGFIIAPKKHDFLIIKFIKSFSNIPGLIFSYNFSNIFYWKNCQNSKKWRLLKFLNLLNVNTNKTTVIIFVFELGIYETPKKQPKTQIWKSNKIFLTKLILQKLIAAGFKNMLDTKKYRKWFINKLKIDKNTQILKVMALSVYNSV